MNLFHVVFEVTILVAVLAAILFIVFGQVTVRKLRKNPKTKSSLGDGFISGWDILNAAQALALPKFISEILERSGLYPNSKLIKEHTNRFDRFLGGAFFWMWVLGAVCCFILFILDMMRV